MVLFSFGTAMQEPLSGIDVVRAEPEFQDPCGVLRGYQIPNF